MFAVVVYVVETGNLGILGGGGQELSLTIFCLTEVVHNIEFARELYVMSNLLFLQ